ncbi:hypothetical protein ZYGR_0H01350 [Zygosaccharomyces rouxii]|uniref:Transcription factor MBP1 n=1 Tax=Zygosaccharomyces rouxii TaxID=4956 RepID=A0A1Q2ZV93_ZYGRO|nr:hypothetical protein ZYGR_0H01350 [Zygosaccharomyces rouxii]
MSSNQIYSAKYSGVDVYEFIHPTGSVMKRRDDDWVNATHILKAARFAKAKRTRILEKEVIKEVHEKVQGGFGKYQGTWVPMDVARTLATKFGVHDELSPLFDFTQTDGSASPPQAPKHHHASRGDSTRKRAVKSASTSAVVEGQQGTALVNPAVSRRRGRPATGQRGKRKLNTTLQRSQSDMGYPRPAIPNSSIATTQLPSIRAAHMNSLVEENDGADDDDNDINNTNNRNNNAGHRAHFKELDIVDGLSSDIEPHGHMTMAHPGLVPGNGANDTTTNSQKLIHGTISSSQSSPSLPTSPSELSEANPFDHRFGSAGTSPIMSAIPRYSIQSRPQNTDIHDKVNEYLSKLVDYFISNEVRSNRSVPTELLLPPPHSAPYIDAPIDPELHTAFHWACSMGNLPILEALVEAGTSTRSTNSQGQTPLMRASMFHNSYSRRTFPRIFELLHDTVFDVDSQLQTVIHHVVKRKSTTPSAVYYLDVILSKLKDFSPQYRIELLLNSQDSFGDTALHIAAENGDKTFFNTLIRNGALSTITNKERLTPNEIMNEHYEQILNKNQAQMNSEINAATNGSGLGVGIGNGVTSGGFTTAGHNASGISANSGGIGLSGKIDSPVGSMTPLLNTAASDYMMFPSQAATRISRCIPEVVASMKQMSDRYNNLYHQRDTDIKNMERTLHSMSKTIRSVNLRTMAVLNNSSFEEFDKTMLEKLTETEKLRWEVKNLRKGMTNRWEKEHYLLLRHFLKQNDTKTQNHDSNGSIDERLKLAVELCVLQLSRKGKLETGLQIVEDSSKIHKYRKMISEGTEMETEKVDSCLDVILESLSNK